MIFNIIKPDKTADFEAVMAKVKEALAKSDKPGRKQMALSWRVFKGAEAGLGGNVVNVFWFDPPVKDEDYSITQILSEGFPNDAQDLWSKFVNCFAAGAQTMLNLSQVVNMSPNATATVPK
jgi:23S rRNA G2069 N7-methylase RlmK/C1962 C5-methylase RlmI